MYPPIFEELLGIFKSPHMGEHVGIKPLVNMFACEWGPTMGLRLSLSAVANMSRASTYLTDRQSPLFS